MTVADEHPATADEAMLTWEGVRTVAALELRQRIRTSRWVVVLSVWALVIYGVALLSWLATGSITDPADGSGISGTAARSVALYSATVFFVLGLSLLVTPSLTASSVNGDREHGVLATLQTTLLTAPEIILGKLLASWAIAGVFLAVGVPVLVFSLFTGGVGFGTLLLALVCVAIVLAATCAIGLLCSTLTARPVTSVVLTYLTVGFLVFGTLILTAVAAPLLRERVERDVRSMQLYNSDGSMAAEQGCVWAKATREEVRTDKIWGLLAINPFVVVADAGPGAGDGRRVFNPLAAISGAAREFRAGPSVPLDECWVDRPSAPAATAAEVGPLWPWGLAALTLTGAGATWLAIRRVETPIRKLPRGTRIA